MQVQDFDSYDEAKAASPRLVAKVASPNTHDTTVMLNRGQRKLRSGYHVRLPETLARFRHYMFRPSA